MKETFGLEIAVLLLSLMSAFHNSYSNLILDVHQFKHSLWRQEHVKILEIGPCGNGPCEALPNWPENVETDSSFQGPLKPQRLIHLRENVS
ncbi:hypothetical protein VNO78_04004 [Psophocarpus tetragonolobus]|uniref:Uncharacterized protein n=1 Tax=Psophocarpus tetragonolobus TaxID=3891 RepID=A0AAN9T359_PSOTE